MHLTRDDGQVELDKNESKKATKQTGQYNAVLNS